MWIGLNGWDGMSPGGVRYGALYTKNYLAKAKEDVKSIVLQSILRQTPEIAENKTCQKCKNNNNKDKWQNIQKRPNKTYLLRFTYNRNIPFLVNLVLGNLGI